MSNRINIRVNRTSRAVHVSTEREDGAINFPLCGAPGNTPAAYRSFRPVVTTDAVTCKRCIKSSGQSAAEQAADNIAASLDGAVIELAELDDDFLAAERAADEAVEAVQLAAERGLSPFELSLLDRIESGYSERFVDRDAPRVSEWTAARLSTPSAVIAYVDRDNAVQIGVVRSARRAADSRDISEDVFDVSPFPGAWERVPESRILSVRHPEAF